MKKLYCVLGIIILCLLESNWAFASDNVFVGMDTVDEVLEDYNTIVSGMNLGTYIDGELSEEELDFSRAQKIYIDTFPDVFKEEKISAEVLKEFLNKSNYVYYIPINRTNESLFLTLAVGAEVSPTANLTEEEVAWIQERAGHWVVTEVGLYDEPRDSTMDYMGLMESYLEYKDIHNAEVYFVSNINPQSMITGIVFTGKQTEAGEDEIIFVAVDTLQYDEAGNLISIGKYELEDDGDYEIEDAEYTYEELRELSKELDMDPGMSGGSGSIVKKRNYGVYVAIIAGVIVLAGIIAVIIKMKVQR